MKVKKDDGKLPRETKLNKVETVNEGSLQKFFELDNFYFAYGCQNYNSSHTRKLLIFKPSRFAADNSYRLCAFSFLAQNGVFETY